MHKCIFVTDSTTPITLQNNFIGLKKICLEIVHNNTVQNMGLLKNVPSAAVHFWGFSKARGK
jgi:hypothetical protein